jgi:DNA-binding NtrC family response regulator
MGAEPGGRSAGVVSSDRTIDRLQRAQAVGKLLGDAPAFRRAIARLPAIARADATVLVYGETGTGKELVARAIHYLSERSAKPFTAVNCGSLPDTLLEDEFFGHERGAFTDARAARTGLFRHTEGGTLFLDEVDSLSQRAQVALLRVLQDRTYRTLGSSHEQRVDVRVIGASNVPLWPLVQQQAFRPDLYYRLSVLTVSLPPLRERPEDILPLTHHFLIRFSTQSGTSFRLSADAKEALLAHSWPGNVRELENAVLRGVSLTESDMITAADLGILPTASDESPRVPKEAGVPENAEALDLNRSFLELKRSVLRSFELAYLTQLLSSCSGNVTHAARRAHKDRRDLGRLLKKHRLDPESFREVPHWP